MDYKEHSHWSSRVECATLPRCAVTALITSVQASCCWTFDFYCKYRLKCTLFNALFINSCVMEWLLEITCNNNLIFAYLLNCLFYSRATQILSTSHWGLDLAVKLLIFDTAYPFIGILLFNFFFITHALINIYTRNWSNRDFHASARPALSAWIIPSMWRPYTIKIMLREDY